MNKSNEEGNEPVEISSTQERTQDSISNEEKMENKIEEVNKKDIESQTQHNFEIENSEIEINISETLKMGFIKKVYGILTFQIFITISLCSLSFIQPVKIFMLSHLYLVYYCSGILVVQMVLLLCFSSILRKVPFNYCILTIWTLLMSYLVATCCACCNSYLVFIAAVTTLIITVLLSVYACISDINYTNGGAIIFGFLGSFLSFWIFYLYIGALNSFYFALGLFFYSLYLIYDTQLLMDKLDYGYNVDDYIIASLNIYIDIIHLFLYILNLLSRLSR